MDSLMAESVQSKHWYLAVGDRSIGPLTTELVARGIESGKVPLTAWICQVGANAWSALSSFGEFQDVVDRVLAAEVPANQQSGRQVKDSKPSRFVSPLPMVPGATSGAGFVARIQPNVRAEAAPVDAAELNPHNEAVSKDTEANRGAPAWNPPNPQAASDALPSFELSADDSDGFLSPPTTSALPYELVESTASSDEEQDVEESDFVTSSLALGEGESLGRDECPGVNDISAEREAVSRLALPDDERSESVTGDSPTTHAEGSVETVDPAVAAARAASRLSQDDLGIDVTFDDDHENAIDWKERFQSYFLVGTEVELPEEDRLLQSLQETPRSTFLHDEALWNLSLCLAFGSEAVAEASARTFFEAFAPEHAPERIEWICRTLLSKGFMPSGIPRSAGMRGIDVLRDVCPMELLDVLECEAVD